LTNDVKGFIIVITKAVSQALSNLYFISCYWWND